ncbi:MULTISPECIES: hypothetical protein [unclassified Mesorhizobium]|uniref:hypothetical protein n=1 Tax=unclassified Mesorhizobium TaxID=325217 RepID=UPI0024161CB9|nr:MULTISPECIES: hypothetical protein [unclassified Mesorhizobium]MDG4901407.1 hypothetical protein [Mesorhizobium sp. WSM4962]MDG4918895.1 hypothetical protein [Mesorhizobium sp. WSM4989]
MRNDQAQLGFDGLLLAAAEDNRKREVERETAHLPSTLEEAIPFYRLLIRQHHAAMLAADVQTAMSLRKKAELLAVRLNGGEPGILAGEVAPGRVLARETAAASGAAPLWGQEGEFAIIVDGTRVRIELDGIFGIGSGFMFWPGFAAHAVDLDRPFISETGYRSFLGIHADPAPGLTPDAFAEKVIAAHIRRELKGRLVAIGPRYRRDAA